MRNIKLTIEYEGTGYCGWQVQKLHNLTTSQSRRLKSIQETIEEALKKILRQKVSLIASGRTDAGVHALGQVANFKTNSKISLKKLMRSSNGLLPTGIKVLKTEEAGQGFHSRFDAKSKTYRYLIVKSKVAPALLRKLVYFFPYPLNIKTMNREARCLVGRHDFKAFCASGSSVKGTVRRVKKISIRPIDSHFFAGQRDDKGASLIAVEIEADGFLYNMVRNIVGTLIEIGRGRFPSGSITQILSAKNRRHAGPTAPAQGLYLIKSVY
ncbi:MAG: tRNA pseudouridine(38-40) synthase TruA [Elusimicrobiota bacterium]